jgi:hypothetical protein
VPDDRGGRKGRCPKCKNAILIPDSQKVADLLTPAPEADSQQPREQPHYNLTFLDKPQKSEPPPEPPPQLSGSDTAEQDQYMLLRGYARPEPDTPPQRKLPWIIDIFLYPANTPGLIIMVIAVALPFVLHALTKFLAIFTMTFPPGIVFLVLLLIIRSLLGVMLFCYLWWYFSECVRDSALGGLRAPETAGNTPGLWELVCIVGRVIACIAVAAIPVIAYLIYTRRIDGTFWILYGCGAFLFPMAWLAVIMFDSLTALNPILIIASILSTLFRYLALAVFFYLPAFVIPFLIYVLPRNWVMDHFLKLVGIYLSMVASHLLGRFHFRAREKLNWEI